MSVPLLLAATDPAWEAAVVAALADDRHPVSVARRCVDLADLLAAAGAGMGRVAVVSAGLRRLDRDALVRLAVAGLGVVGVTPAGDEAAARRLRQLGVRQVVSTADPVDAVVAAALASLGDPRPAAGDLADPRVAHSAPAPQPLPDVDVDHAAGGSRVIAVWGPTGAPGRSTVAVTLAAEFARQAGGAVLVDADTYGAAVAQLLGLLDEAPGLAAACRLANAGRLDRSRLAEVAVRVGRMLVLTGLPRPDRWPELRPDAVRTVLAACRLLAPVTVVDTGFCLETDEELSFDTAAPRRNGATLAALEAADEVVVVAAADPVGLQRLVRGLGGLREAAPAATVRVVVNRCRPGPVPGEPRAEIAAALRRYAGVAAPYFLPEDRAACDAALAAGRTLAEVAAGSRLHAALSRLAAELLGEAAPAQVAAAR